MIKPMRTKLHYLLPLALLLVGACQSTTPPQQQGAPAPTPASDHPMVDAYRSFLSWSAFKDWASSSTDLLTSSVKREFTVSHPPPPSPPQITFTRFQPIVLNVGQIDIVDEYKMPMHEPNVEHLIPISPSDAMRAWVRDRIRAGGETKTLQVIIKDASVVASEVPLPPGADPGDVSPDRRYDARLEVELRIYGTENAMSEASVNVVATQSNTINEKASLSERKAIFRRMVSSVMDSANAELEKQIFQYFNSSILYSQTP